LVVRRPLFVAGQLLSAVPLLILAFSQNLDVGTVQILVTASFFFITWLAISLSTYTAELYPTEMRALGCGVGNAWLRDDAFGGECARRLEAEGVPDGVSVMDVGTSGLDLAYEVMRGYDALVIVDVSQQGGEPGTLYVMEPDEQSVDGNIADGEANWVAVLREFYDPFHQTVVNVGDGGKIQPPEVVLPGGAGRTAGSGSTGRAGGGTGGRADPPRPDDACSGLFGR
jgi:hypothetical protein